MPRVRKYASLVNAGLVIPFVLLSASAGCGSSQVTSPSQPQPEPGTAPTHVVADGQGLTLSAEPWLDLEPSDEPPSLSVLLKISTDDHAPVSLGVKADVGWVLYQGQTWVAPASEERARSEDPLVYQTVMRGGPKWGPRVSVDVVVHLADSAGRVYLLRAPDQLVTALY
jgi:hypothetical protein